MSRAAVPRISVALGTHNGAPYLAAQLHSILEQSTPVHEIVLSDDASSDGTIALAERLLAEVEETDGSAPTLVVLRNRVPLGVTANFEQALRASSGDLIALSDQDDVWRADRIARAVERFATAPSLDLVASDARLVDASGEPFGATLFGTLGADAQARHDLESKRAFEVLLKRNLVTGATAMVTRRLVEHASPFPSSWVHDEWLAMAAAMGGGIGIIEEPLVDYRQHGGNQIGVRRLSAGRKLARLLEPRTVRNARLLERAAELAARTPSLVPGDERIAVAVRAKLEHERVRDALPAGRARRAAPIWREWRSGAYSRYGLGMQDVLRDLVQPT